MIFWLIFLSPVVFLASGWAWRYQLRVLHLTGAGTAHIAGRPGTVADVQLTSVLVDGPSVIICFQAAAASRQSGPSPLVSALRHGQNLVVCLDAGAEVDVAALREWEAGEVPLVMWRDGSGDRVELSVLRTGQRVALSVAADVATETTPC
jgi:hypothetical protein